MARVKFLLVAKRSLKQALLVFLLIIHQRITNLLRVKVQTFMCGIKTLLLKEVSLQMRETMLLRGITPRLMNGLAVVFNRVKYGI